MSSSPYLRSAMVWFPFIQWSGASSCLCRNVGWCSGAVQWCSGAVYSGWVQHSLLTYLWCWSGEDSFTIGNRSCHPGPDHVWRLEHWTTCLNGHKHTGSHTWEKLSLGTGNKLKLWVLKYNIVIRLFNKPSVAKAVLQTLFKLYWLMSQSVILLFK